MPLIVPTIIYSVAVYGLFSSLRLIGDWRGIVLGHTVHAIPYVVVIMTAALRTFDIALENAAMGLGASRLRAIWRVTLPQIRPALISAIFLAFISSFDELVIAMFLGGANIDAAEEDVRQHPQCDRSDDRGGVGAADPDRVHRAAGVGAVRGGSAAGARLFGTPLRVECPGRQFTTV